MSSTALSGTVGTSARYHMVLQTAVRWYGCARRQGQVLPDGMVLSAEISSDAYTLCSPAYHASGSVADRLHLAVSEVRWPKLPATRLTLEHDRQQAIKAHDEQSTGMASIGVWAGEAYQVPRYKHCTLYRTIAPCVQVKVSLRGQILIARPA